MSDPTVSELVERVRRLEDEAAVHSTLYAYGTSIDYGDRDRFLACFAPDADYRVDMRIAGVTALEFHGHGELGGYFDGHTHAPAAWHKHITTNIAVTVDGDTATATSYFVRVDAGDEAGPATVLASGRYDDTLVRDGAHWRIRTRRCEVENL
jgi:3-phenylpropionate/cinnamic acid dioxygenase small subunit